jgi:hypothetical protein
VRVNVSLAPLATCAPVPLKLQSPVTLQRSTKIRHYRLFANLALKTMSAQFPMAYLKLALLVITLLRAPESAPSLDR